MFGGDSIEIFGRVCGTSASPSQASGISLRPCWTIYFVIVFALYVNTHVLSCVDENRNFSAAADDSNVTMVVVSRLRGVRKKKRPTRTKTARKAVCCSAADDRRPTNYCRGRVCPSSPPPSFCYRRAFSCRASRRISSCCSS